MTGLDLAAQSSGNKSGSKVTISGYVTDADNGEAVIGANVFDARTLTGTVTNIYGFYSLSLPADSLALTFSYVGYEAQAYGWQPLRDTTISVALSPQLELEEVEIVAAKQETGAETSQMSAVKIPIKQILAMPAFAGEVDIIKALQLMPGIQSGSEGGSGLYVRGGGPDQNLVLLDGVPVYNVQHLFGFFSVFNANAISNIELIKGGFPARYGGRLSSVLDIRMKEGNRKQYSGEIGVGLISSKGLIEGPIVKDKVSFMVTGRRTYIDILARPIIRRNFNNDGQSGLAGYYFYDFNAKVNWKISERDNLYLSYYGGRDRGFTTIGDNYEFDGTTYEEDINFSLGWGNQIAALRWNHVFNPKLFANTTATFSNYDLSIGSGYSDTQISGDASYVLSQQIDYNSLIRDWALKTDFEYFPNPNHYVRWGGQAIRHRFEPGVASFNYEESFALDTLNVGENFDTSFATLQTPALELSAYIEDDWSLTSRLKINAGLHASLFAVESTTYTSLQPRVSGRYKLGKNQSLKASFVTMAQFLHLLSTATISLPTDLWVPATDIVKPQRSWQVATGWAGSFWDDYEFSAEAYYKHMDNLIAYKDGANFILSTEPWDEKVTLGEGESYGLELLAQRKYGKLTGWIGYTLSWTWRQFEEINFGERFPFRYDRRHDVSFVANYKLNDRIDFGAVWVYGTGTAVTLDNAKYLGFRGVRDDGSPIIQGENLAYSSRNNYRLPAYHRMDISVNFHKQKKRGERTWSVSVYNLYNRRNAFFVYKDVSQNGARVNLRQVSLFPILPSFSYNFKF